jgi:hypothetical protein
LPIGVTDLRLWSMLKRVRSQRIGWALPNGTLLPDRSKSCPTERRAYNVSMDDDPALRELLDRGDELIERSKTVQEVCKEQGEAVRAVMEESGRVMRAACALTRHLYSARAEKDEKARPG